MNIKYIIILTIIPFLLFSNDSKSEITLGEIVVEDSYVTKIETIHSIKDKEKDGKENLKGIIENVPSLHFNIGSRGEANFSLRGFSGREIPILIDGIPIYMPYSGSIDLFKIKSESIKEVKISSGLSSVLYGPNSSGGAINIITKAPRKGLSYSVWEEMKFEQMDGIIGATLSYSTGKYYISLMPQYQESKGYKVSSKKDIIENNTLKEDGGLRENSDNESYSNTLLLGYKNKKGNYRLSWHHISEERGMPIELNNNRARFWRFPEWRKDNIAFLSNNKIKNHNFKTRLFYDTYYNKLQAYKDIEFKEKKFDSIYDDYSYGVITNYALTFFDTQKVEFVLNYKYDIHRDGETKDKSGNIVKLSDYNTYENKTFSIASEYSTEFDDFSFLAGIAFDSMNFNEKDKDSTNRFSINPQIGLTYWLDDEISISTSIGKKSRFPTLKEIFSSKKWSIPNPKLKPEDVIHSQLSLNYKNKINKINISLYYSNINNLIEAINLVEQNKEQLQNVGNAKYMGVEFSYQAELLKVLYINLNYNYQYSYSENLPKHKVPFQPENNLKFGIDYKTPFSSIVSLNTYFLTSQHELDRDNKMINIKGYTKIDFKFTQKITFFKNTEVYLKVNNILDSYIYTQNNFPLAGREFYLGVKINY